MHKACKMGQAPPVARAWAEEAALPEGGAAVPLAPLVECLPLPSLDPFLVGLVRALLLLLVLPPTAPDAAAADADADARAQRALERGFGAVLSAAPPSTQAQALRALLVSKLLITGGAGAAGGAGSTRLLPRRAAPLLLRLAAGGGQGLG